MPEEQDSANNPPEPPAARPIAYQPRRTVEERLTRLERELRLFQVVGTLMALFVLVLLWLVLRSMRII